MSCFQLHIFFAHTLKNTFKNYDMGDTPFKGFFLSQTHVNMTQMSHAYSYLTQNLVLTSTKFWSVVNCPVELY